MKLLCVSAAADESDQPESNGSSRLRVWYNSIRKGLKRNKDPRVTISDPIQMEISQSEMIQKINGVIEVKPCVDDNNANAILERVNNNELDSEVIEDKPHQTIEPADYQNVTGNDQTVAVSEPVKVEAVSEEPQADIPPIEMDEEEETNEKIVGYVWFWGSISRREAESLLRGKKDGSFLVRESSDSRFLYSLSFRSNGKTMHTRIEHSNGLFFFYSNDSSSSRTSDGSRTLGGLISVAMNQNNADSIFFYSRGLRNESSLHTVSLDQPLSRYQYLLDYEYGVNENKALQYMCKFVTHHCPAAKDKLDQQMESLPVEIRHFADSAFYFPRKAIPAN